MSQPGKKTAAGKEAKSSLPLILGLSAGGIVLVAAIGVGVYFAMSKPAATVQPVVAQKTQPEVKTPKGTAKDDPTPPPVKKAGEFEATLLPGKFEVPQTEQGTQFRVEDVAGATAVPAVLVATVIDPAIVDKKETVKPIPEADRKAWVTFTHRADLSAFGIKTTRDAPGDSANKALTYAQDGSTNTTIFRIDNGTATFAAQPGKITKNERTNDPVPASEIIWQVGALEITERLEVVEGPPVDTKEGSRRFFNTVLVRYKFANKDKRAHNVGMRMVVDTLIGANDGVPFAVPGYPGLVENFADFRTPKQIPAFVQALERPNLRQPGTVAQANLKIGGGVDGPDRVLLTHWPGASTAWDVPLLPPTGDSCIVLYWNDKPLPAGAVREVGFEYGLGSVSSSGGKLGVTLGGQFDVGGYFQVSAYVQGPTPKQTLTLTLPPGLERLDGAATLPVPPSKTTSVVTWKVQIKKAGQFEIKVASNDGLEQIKILSIGGEAGGVVGGGTGKKLALNFAGPYEAGKPFKVAAEIADPEPNQTVTLELPNGITLAEGERMRPVPAANAGKTATVEWRCVAAAAGKFDFQVGSSSNETARKTLLLEARAKDPGTIALSIAPTDQAAKTFLVTAEVYEPLPEQKLKIDLPKGISLIEAEATMPVKIPETGNTTTIRWPIRVAEDGTHLVKVDSTPGPSASKKLTLSGPAPIRDRFTLKLDGDWKPGETATLVAVVTDPSKDQSLTLTLPAGLELVDPAGQPVPSNAATLFGGDIRVSWKVRVAQAGSFPVRVASSTGTALAATIDVRAH